MYDDEKIKAKKEISTMLTGELHTKEALQKQLKYYRGIVNYCDPKERGNYRICVTTQPPHHFS